MSQLSIPETELMAEIERLEMEARVIRRHIDHAHSAADKRVLNRQLAELKADIERLQARLS